MVATIGIDSYKATHAAVAVDESETVLGEITISADRYQTTLMDWARNVDGDGGRLWRLRLLVGSAVCCRSSSLPAVNRWWMCPDVGLSGSSVFLREVEQERPE